jgi:hypothetical protein
MREFRVSMLMLATVLTLPSQTSKPPVREEVSVNGETWRLEWKSSPVSVCGPENDDFSTCPCRGFAFGEAGKLDLVRLRGNKEVDRLPLASLFFDEPPILGLVAIQRYEVASEDLGKEGTPELSRMIAQRKLVQVINLADYNHDGQATEFFLPTSAGPCGHVDGVVVGVTKINPRLHAFRTVKNPGKPLVLRRSEWEKLRESTGPVETVGWACGDHAAEDERTHYLTPTSAGIRVLVRTYNCSETGRGKLLREVEQ